jgi:RND family efflux transporter MFP subunit
MSWEHGEKVLLYCAVGVPFKHQISSHADAELIWVLPEGSLVKEGDLLAKQDNFHLERKSEMLNIRLSDTKSKMTFNNKEFIRLKKLSKEHVSESQLNGVKRNYDKSKYEFTEMEQERKVLNYRISRLEHRASTVGRVAKLTANLGENIVIGQPILQLIPTLSKELTCSIPLDVYDNKDLSTVDFQFDGRYILSYKRQLASANNVEQSLTIYLSLPLELQSRLVIGKRLQVTMYQKQVNLTQVPFDAMVLEDDGNYVWVLSEDNKVRKQSVDIVSTQAAYFIVHSELKVGSRVVVRGKQSMEAGKEVSPVRNIL